MKKIVAIVAVASALAPGVAYAADQQAQSRIERLEEIIVTAPKTAPADDKIDEKTAALLVEIKASK